MSDKYATRSTVLPKFVGNRLKQTLRSSAFKLKPSIIHEFTKLCTKLGNQIIVFFYWKLVRL